MVPPIYSLNEKFEFKKKLQFLEEKFFEEFNAKPNFYARAPGRVNLIGEHIDYCGYAVFPMAIQQCVIVAVAHREDTILKITNYDPDYEKFECSINEFKIDLVPTKWYKYMLCGIQGLIEDLQSQSKLGGLSLLVYGDIPPAAGLSSSSALVCAAALITSHALHAGLTRKRLAEICASSEKYIGTQGGGMDQAASFLSIDGSAQLIEFDPLRCTPVGLPKSAHFVVLNSLAIKEKATSSEFNTRVMECKLASRILIKQSNMNISLHENLTLGKVQNKLGRTYSQMVELVKEYLHPQPYSKTEICQLLDLSFAEFEKELVTFSTRGVTEFQLHKRALHVFTEASRVWEFKNICDEWNDQESSPAKELQVLCRLGKLMLESHASAQHLYECSHPQLDELVELSKNVAVGARLTGAGWGGCIVALVLQHRVEEYVEKIKKEYYGAKGFKVDDWDSVIFSSKPVEGANIYANS